jgi:hypothetical protein
MTALDTSSLLGDWRNTNANGTIARIQVEDRRSRLSGQAGLPVLHVSCSDWGTVEAPVFAFEFDATNAGAFYALYQRGGEELRVQANVKLGVLVVVTLFRYSDDSGRSNYFNREFFYRIPE